MASVEFRSISKRFPDGTHAVRDLSLQIQDGEFLVVVGPSGCGKSTLLRMLAGLESASGGDILIGGERVNDREPQQRDIAMVFQNYALYPHMSVRRNLEFPLRMRKLPRAQIEARVRETAGLLELDRLLERRPAQLSGGERQRVAMGRALVRKPSVFLMDEPLSNLDARLRVQIRTEIATLQQRIGVTTLYVTHDQVEAMTLGHRVAVLKRGALQQVDTPLNLYDRPANTFVAGFLGNPGMNIFPVQLSPGHDRLIAGEQDLASPAHVQARLESMQTGTLFAGIRPEAFMATEPSGRDITAMDLLVAGAESIGHEKLVYCTLPGTEPAQSPDNGHIVARLPVHQEVHVGKRLRLYFRPDQLYLFSHDGLALTGPGQLP